MGTLHPVEGLWQSSDIRVLKRCEHLIHALTSQGKTEGQGAHLPCCLAAPWDDESDLKSRSNGLKYLKGFTQFPETEQKILVH